MGKGKGDVLRFESVQPNRLLVAAGGDEHIVTEERVDRREFIRVPGDRELNGAVERVGGVGNLSAVGEGR